MKLCLLIFVTSMMAVGCQAEDTGTIPDTSEAGESTGDEPETDGEETLAEFEAEGLAELARIGLAELGLTDGLLQIPSPGWWMEGSFWDGWWTWWTDTNQELLKVKTAEGIVVLICVVRTDLLKKVEETQQRHTELLKKVEKVKENQEIHKEWLMKVEEFQTELKIASLQGKMNAVHLLLHPSASDPKIADLQHLITEVRLLPASDPEIFTPYLKQQFTGIFTTYLKQKLDELLLLRVHEVVPFTKIADLLQTITALLKTDGLDPEILEQIADILKLINKLLPEDPEEQIADILLQITALLRTDGLDLEILEQINNILHQINMLLRTDGLDPEEHFALLEEMYRILMNLNINLQ